jgi:hypothetical protein
MSRFIEFINEKYKQRYESLKGLSLFAEMKTLGSYKSDTLTSKMWILPNGEVKSISGWHYKWILNNKTIAAKYGIDTSNLPDDETPVRIAAIKAGFFRINFEIRNGALTIEGLAGKYHKKIKDAVFMLILENSINIGYFNLNLFNDDVTSTVVSKSIPLFKYDDDEKLMALDGII